MNTQVFEGTLIDEKYRVGEHLGQGGMGQILAATHLLTGREVALKLLHGPMVTDSSFRERFMREIRLSSNLRHRNIVEVFDAGEDEGGGLYMAMERLSGEPMEDWLLSDRFTQDKALRVIMQVARAVAYAHEHGIVHRDLKPDNVFVVDRPSVPLHAKVLDFGIAKPMAHPSVTVTGTVMGTPGYMSPEQGITPEKVGPAADIWSLGVMLYEVVTGTLPFNGENPNIILVRALSDPHPPLRSDVDPRMCALIDSCLQKLPKDRGHDADTIANELHDLLRDRAKLGKRRAPATGASSPEQVYINLARRSSPTPSGESTDNKTPTPRPKRARAALFAVALLLCAVGAFAYQAHAPEPSRPATARANVQPALPPIVSSVDASIEAMVSNPVADAGPADAAVTDEVEPLQRTQRRPRVHSARPSTPDAAVSKPSPTVDATLSRPSALVLPLPETKPRLIKKQVKAATTPKQPPALEPSHAGAQKEAKKKERPSEPPPFSF